MHCFALTFKGSWVFPFIAAHKAILLFCIKFWGLGTGDLKLGTVDLGTKNVEISVVEIVWQSLRRATSPQSLFPNSYIFYLK